jgi:hypothetical protein
VLRWKAKRLLTLSPSLTRSFHWRRTDLDHGILPPDGDCEKAGPGERICFLSPVILRLLCLLCSACCGRWLRSHGWIFFELALLVMTARRANDDSSSSHPKHNKGGPSYRYLKNQRRSNAAPGPANGESTRSPQRSTRPAATGILEASSSAATRWGHPSRYYP